MNKISQILAVISLSLLSACYNSGYQLDKQNVSNAPSDVSRQVVNQNNSVTGAAASTANSVTRAVNKK